MSLPPKQFSAGPPPNGFYTPSSAQGQMAISQAVSAPAVCTSRILQISEALIYNGSGGDDGTTAEDFQETLEDMVEGCSEHGKVGLEDMVEGCSGHGKVGADSLTTVN